MYVGLAALGWAHGRRGGRPPSQEAGERRAIARRFVDFSRGVCNGVLCFRTTFYKQDSKQSPKTYHSAADVPQEVEKASSDSAARERK